MAVMSDASSSEHFSRLLGSLVTHYIQPIHCSPGFEDEEQQMEEDPGSPVLPPFLEAVRQQSLRHGCSAKYAMHHFLCMYKSHVRAALYASRSCSSREQRFSRLGLSVLRHYELLVSSLDSVEAKITGSIATAEEADQALAAGTLSREESILYLANDITAIQGRHAIEEEEERGDEQTRPDTSRLQRTMLRIFLRLLCNMLRGLEHIQVETAQRCFISLLNFCAPSSYESMDQMTLQNIFDLNQYVNIPTQETVDAVSDKVEFWRIVMLNDSCTLKITDNIDFPSERIGIEALTLLERVVTSQEPQHQSKISSFVQVVHDDNMDGLPEHLRARCRIIRCMGGDACMANAIRAHFFGRDMLPEDRIVVPPLQRLHLGKSITETPKQEYKHYRCNPSRALVAISFCRLTSCLTQASFDDLVPIVYDLINDSDDKVRWAAVVLLHLLKIAPDTWRENPIVCENLMQMMYKELQPMRDGRSLLLVGLVQTSLFQIIVNNDCDDNKRSDIWIQQRRKATQQWLMMLKQNNMSFTKNHLVLGALYGGILPFLHMHANSPTLDGLEMGRLGLQALLPVLQQGLESDVWMADDDEISPLSNAERAALKMLIHRGALIALSNLFLAAHPIIGQHQGKILCTLVAFIRTSGTKGYSLNHKLAEDVAAVALNMGESNKKVKDAIVRRIMGDYDQEVQRIMASIQGREETFART